MKTQGWAAQWPLIVRNLSCHDLSWKGAGTDESEVVGKKKVEKEERDRDKYQGGPRRRRGDGTD